MKKITKLLCLSLTLVCLFTLGSLIAYKQELSQGVVRLHVIANSDSQTDQAQKLLVKDAVVDYLQPRVQHISNKEQALQYLAQELPQLQKVANAALQEAGSAQSATVELNKRVFDTRDYDTFSLPAGVYDALCVQIGAAEGKNWWCVVFPSLCLPATGDDFAVTAASSGFDAGLVNTLQKNDGYEIRFFLLDCIGKLENFFAK